MSNELNSLQRSLRESSNAVRAITAAAIRRHGALLEDSVLAELEQLEKGISRWQKTLAGCLLKSFLWGMGLAVGLGIAGACTLVLMAGRLQRIQSTTAQWESRLGEIRSEAERLEKETWGLKLLEDHQGRFIVLPPGIVAKPGWTLGNRQALRLE